VAFLVGPTPNLNLHLKYKHTSLFGSAVQPAFHQILIFFFAKIECGLYFLDRFDVLMSKIIFKK
jgi:hypothetical protein